MCVHVCVFIRIGLCQSFQTAVLTFSPVTAHSIKVRPLVPCSLTALVHVRVSVVERNPREWCHLGLICCPFQLAVAGARQTPPRQTGHPSFSPSLFQLAWLPACFSPTVLPLLLHLHLSLHSSFLVSSSPLFGSPGCLAAAERQCSLSVARRRGGERCCGVYKG